MNILAIIATILAGATNIFSIYGGERTGSLAKEISRLIAAGFMLAERLGVPISQADIDRWKKDIDQRTKILAEGEEE